MGKTKTKKIHLVSKARAPRLVRKEESQEEEEKRKKEKEKKSKIQVCCCLRIKCIGFLGLWYGD